MQREIELIRAAKYGNDTAKSILIRNCEAEIRKIASQYRNSEIPQEDLRQEGRIGVIIAIEHFDIKKEVRFYTFAKFHIKRSIIDAIRGYGHLIRVPVSSFADWKEILDSAKSLRDRGFKPTTQAISDDTMFEEEYIDKLRCVFQTPASIEAIVFDHLPQYSSIADTLEEIMENPALMNGLAGFKEKVEYSLDLQRVSWTIHKSLKILSKREYQVITRLYGLDGKNSMRPVEIAKELKITMPRVSHLHTSARKRLAQAVGNQLSWFIADDA